MFNIRGVCRFCQGQPDYFMAAVSLICSGYSDIPSCEFLLQKYLHRHFIDIEVFILCQHIWVSPIFTINARKYCFVLIECGGVYILNIER